MNVPVETEAPVNVPAKPDSLPLAHDMVSDNQESVLVAAPYAITATKAQSRKVYTRYGIFN